MDNSTDSSSHNRKGRASGHHMVAKSQTPRVEIWHSDPGKVSIHLPDRDVEHAFSPYVLVDGRPAKVHSFTPCPIQSMGGRPVPGYHLECSWPERTRGRHVLKVVVHHVARMGDGTEILEEGEATFWDLQFPGGDI